MGLGAGQTPVKSKSYSPFDIWMEAHYQSFTDDRDSTRSDGHFGVVYVGADYVVNRSLLVGALVQFDSTQQRSNAEAFDVKGKGWMAGPYATVRLTDNLFFQTRAAIGQSTNEVSPFLTYTDTFETRRWLATGALVGRWKFGDLQIRPSASIAYIEDVSAAYIDSLGVTIPGLKVALGQFKAGPEFSYKFDIGNGASLQPRIGFQAIWNFAGSDRVADFGGTLSGPEDLRGRVELGLTAKSSSGLNLDISGSYDGIGSDTFHAIGGKATIRIPLQ